MDELIDRVVALLTAAGLSAQAADDGFLHRVAAARYAVALKWAECISGAAYDYYGQKTVDGSEVAVFGKRMKAAASVTVLVPKAEDMPSAIDDAIEALCGEIVGATLKKITVGETEYRPREDAFACVITLQYTAVLFAESDEDEPEFLSFRLEGVAG